MLVLSIATCQLRTHAKHTRTLGHLGGRQITATTAVGLGCSQRRSSVCCGWLPFHLAHLSSFCFGMAPASFDSKKGDLCSSRLVHER